MQHLEVCTRQGAVKFYVNIMQHIAPCLLNVILFEVQCKNWDVVTLTRVSVDVITWCLMRPSYTGSFVAR